jgi:hypothetical protein
VRVAENRAPHSHEPAAVARDPDLRASDAERERVADLLRAEAGDGRLDVEELAERLDRAYASRTRGELAALVADLPSRGASPRRPIATPPAGGLAGHAAGFVALTVLLVAIWALTGAGAFWPAWAIGFSALGLVGRARGPGSCGVGRRRVDGPTP